MFQATLLRPIIPVRARQPANCGPTHMLFRLCRALESSLHPVHLANPHIINDFWGAHAPRVSFPAPSPETSFHAAPRPHGVILRWSPTIRVPILAAFSSLDSDLHSLYRYFTLLSKVWFV